MKVNSMSGGAYDYKYTNLDDLADRMAPNRDDHQKIRERVATALRELAKVCHDVEWIDSGDYGPEDWEDIIQWLDKHNL